MNDTLQILERVNAFYSSSFNQLITYTVALLASVGALLPLFIALQQSKQAKRDQQSLAKEVEEKLAEARTDLIRSVNEEVKQIEDRLKKSHDALKVELEREIARVEASADAGVFHNQALHNVEKEAWSNAVQDAFYAGANYAKCHDELNLQAAITIITDSLPNVTADSLRTQSHFQEAHDMFFKEVKGLNDRGRYTRQLDTIAQLVDKAKTEKARSRGKVDTA